MVEKFKNSKQWAKQISIKKFDLKENLNFLKKLNLYNLFEIYVNSHWKIFM